MNKRKEKEDVATVDEWEIGKLKKKRQQRIMGAGLSQHEAIANCNRQE